jgi:hypothetical protein
MANPVSRITGVLGLLMLGAIAYQLVIGQVTMAAAGGRAAMTLAAVVVVRRLGRFGMDALAGAMEREAANHQRRSTDVTDRQPA